MPSDTWTSNGADRSGLLERFGLVGRQPARGVTVWVGDESLLPSALVIARLIRRRFPRTPVVFVRKPGVTGAAEFRAYMAPVAPATRLLLMRLRTQTLIFAGPLSGTAPPPALLAAYARGASLVLLARGTSVPARTPIESPLDAILDADALLPALATDDAVPDGGAVIATVDRLVTRSRKQTMVQRGRLTPGVRLLRQLQQVPWRGLLGFKFRQYESIEALSEGLGRPDTILCLGNGPSSERPELRDLPHDRLFRVNMSWRERGFLTQPDLVFTGLLEAVQTLRPSAGFVFGTIQSEEKMLSRCLPSLRRLRYATAERLGMLARGPVADVAPTNGALMLATAVALQPRRLVVAGIDLFSHPAGAYPGDTSTANTYASGHDARLELDYILAALKRYRGELVILSDVLRQALERAR